MAKLSPAAKAIDFAVYGPGTGATRRDIAAAALRAVADHARRGPEHWEGSHPDDFDKGWDEAMGWVAIIAAELDGGTTTPTES